MIDAAFPLAHYLDQGLCEDEECTEVYANAIQYKLSRLLTLVLELAAPDFLAMAKEKNIDLSLSITMLSPDAMRQYNAETRGKDAVTDVLSFPSEDFYEGVLQQSIETLTLLPTASGRSELFLGELLVCGERAKFQATEYGHSFDREFLFLCTHGFLHLLGYDHEEGEREESLMFKLQDQILLTMGVDRRKDEPYFEDLEADADAFEVLVDNSQGLLSWWSEELWAETNEDDNAFLSMGFPELSMDTYVPPLEYDLSLEEEDTDDSEAFEEPIEATLDFQFGKEAEDFKSGFVSILGRPNVGKSTLLNALAGAYLAIATPKAQTTRRNVRAVVHREKSQIIFTDTPGIHKPDNKLGSYMARSAKEALKDADLILMMADAHFIKPGQVEQKLCSELKGLNKKVLLLLNKVDDIPKAQLLPTIQNYLKLYSFEEIIPISAKKEDGLEDLLKTIERFLPFGPRYYEPTAFTDQSERSLAAELIREQILTYVHQEIPHGTGVLIERFEECLNENHERYLVKITASILCERDTHKGMIIGKEGKALKRLGSSARIYLEKMLDCKVYLELHVKVRKKWRDTDHFLNELGYKASDFKNAPDIR